MATKPLSKNKPGATDASSNKPAQKSYYIKKRSPSEQLWPDQKIEERIISTDIFMNGAVSRAAGLLKKSFRLERKASVALTMGHFCTVGMDAAAGANMAYSSSSTLRTVNMRVVMPIQYWEQLDRIKFASAPTQTRRTIQELVDAYTRLGLQMESHADGGSSTS